MRTSTFRFMLTLCAVIALGYLHLSRPAEATITYSSPGTHAGVPNNGGFTVGGTVDGWISFRLLNDSPFAQTDMFVVHGEHYPLRLKDLILYSAGGPASIIVDDASTCGFTRSFLVSDVPGSGGIECEEDDSRPEIADPELVPPGPNLPFNVGCYAGGDGETDILSWTSGDNNYWTTIQHQAGYFYASVGGIRRCRYVSEVFLTCVAP